MSRLRSILKTSLFTVLTGLMVTPAYAQYPSKPIKVVHTSSPGAPIDVLMRTLGHQMEKVANTSVVVEGRPGGSGQVAISYLKGQPADGHTIFVDATGITATLQLPGAAHDWRDLAPVYRIQLDPFALYVKRDGQYSELADLLGDMRERGEQVRIGGYGTGSAHQLAALAMAELADVDIRWVQYSGGADAVAAVMSGDLDAAMSNVSIYDRFKERVQILAHTADERLTAHPDIPTFTDEGLDLARYHWRGAFVHVDTPTDIVDELYRIMDEAAQSEEFHEFLQQTSTLSGRMSREEFAALLEDQATSDRKILIQLGMLPDTE